MNNILKKSFIKLWLIGLLSTFLFIWYSNQIVFAEDNNDLKVEGLNILPKIEDDDLSDINDRIKKVWSTWWHVWDNYNKQATDEGMTTTKQIMTWIMTRDTIMNYLVFIIKFLSQAWITVWALFIMYAWYQYMTSVFSDNRPDSKMIKNAIIWILIVIFSYAIMKALTSIAGLS